MRQEKVVPINKRAELLADFSNTLEQAILNAYIANKRRDARRRMMHVGAALLLSLLGILLYLR